MLVARASFPTLRGLLCSVLSRRQCAQPDKPNDTPLRRVRAPEQLEKVTALASFPSLFASLPMRFYSDAHRAI